MVCIVKKHHLKVLFKEMQFVAFFIFHMGKTRMQVKNDLRCLRQTNKRITDNSSQRQLAPRQLTPHKTRSKSGASCIGASFM